MVHETNLTGTAIDRSTGSCFHHSFEEQVARSPAATAIVFEGQALTYEDLNRRANQLAHYLRDLGVGPEKIVGVFTDRSPELVVAILGILKAGGACVTLDPAYPGERLAFMLEDTQVSVIVCQEKLIGNLPDHQAQLVTLNCSRQVTGQESDETPGSLVSNDNLAFVFFTSGSTGRPKGVLGTHRAHMSDLLWKQAKLGLTGRDRYLLKCSISFSPFLRELFCPLFTGATVVMADTNAHQDFSRLVQLIREWSISVISFVPSALQVFLEEPGVESCNSLRHVLCGGEAFSAELRRRFFACLDAELHLFYGATEAPAATYRRCYPRDEHKAVILGRPTNMVVRLLDTKLQPVTEGGLGEVCIGGPGISRGYLNQPELTAKKYIPDPLGGNSGTRLFRTGDRGRYLSDGNIEFLGRIDHQIKIRGFRVEPAEIEAVLGRHPGVRQAVVVAREDTPGDKRLVTYFVPHPGPEPTVAELRTFVKDSLPDYMVPTAYISLDVLPLTANGKIDRKALRARGNAPARRPGISRPPRDPIELSITKCWCEVLQLQDVQLDDNFFDLGGHSLPHGSCVVGFQDQT